MASVTVGVLPALAVAGRARVGARAPGPHPEAAAGVQPGDAAAAGADRGHVDQRHAHRVAADPPLGREERLALPHQRDVAARSPDVDGDQVLVAGALAGELPPDHAGRWPRQHGGDRLGDGGLAGRDAAPRLHDLEVDDDPHLAKGLAERRQVPAHDRPDVGVERGEAGALVLAEGRVDVARQRDRHPRRHLGDDLPGPRLVARVDEREQVGDRQRLHVLLVDQHPHRGPDLVLVQRHHHRSGGVDPLGDADPPAARGQEHRRLGVEEQVVHLRPVLPPDLQDVLEAGGGQEAEPGALLLQDGVGGDGGAVDEAGDLRGRLPAHLEESLDAAPHPLDEVGRRRGHLGEVHGLLALEADHVGERPADVDADAQHGRSPVGLSGEDTPPTPSRGSSS